MYLVRCMQCMCKLLCVAVQGAWFIVQGKALGYVWLVDRRQTCWNSDQHCWPRPNHGEGVSSITGNLYIHTYVCVYVCDIPHGQREFKIQQFQCYYTVLT